jgi:hypothetical protein
MGVIRCAYWWGALRAEIGYAARIDWVRCAQKSGKIFIENQRKSEKIRENQRKSGGIHIS